MPTEFKALSSLINAAIQQRKFMLPWLNDCRFRRKGGAIIHAVDTDVIVFYMEPEDVSITKDERQGYAEVFPNDNPDLCVTLGRELVKHIFYHLDENHPLPILPPMEQEVGRVFHSLVLRANSEHAQAKEELKKLRKQLSELVRSLSQEKDQQDLVAMLENEVPMLAKLLRGKGGASTALHRLRTLFRDKRIAPLKFALEKNWLSEDSELLWQAMTPPSEEFIHQVAFIELRDEWFSRLLKSKSKSHSRLKIHDDATVLARLEWINSQLDQTRYRLVLITGDLSIHKAADSYILNSEDQCFGDLYLRHPRAYLAEPGVLSPKSPHKLEPLHDMAGLETEETELLDWLDTFLGVFGEIQGRGTRDLEQILASYPRIVEEFKERWGGYTKNLFLVHGLEGLEDLVDEIMDKPSLRTDISAILQRVEDSLNRRIWDTWEACFEVATHVGLFNQPIQQGLRSSNPPVLYFDSFKKATKFLEQWKASQWDLSDSNNLTALREEDKSRYTYFLAYAVLFAAKGNWHISAVLAERAMEIADSKDFLHIAGRESAYMLAVARRHNARQLEDLSEIDMWLDKATRRLEERNSEAGSSLKASGIRFISEHWSLNLTYHLFSSFQDSPLPEDRPTLAEIQRNLQELLKQLDECQTETIIQYTVERDLLTNLFMTALLRWGKLKEVVEPREFGSALERFTSNIEKAQIELTFLVQAIYSTARWWIAEDPKEKKRFRRKLSELLSDNEIKNHKVFPYDVRRFQFLRNLATTTAGIRTEI